MAQIALSNTAPDTLLVGDISASTGTIIVSAGTGSAFPAVPFRVGIDREAMLVTARNGDTFTVTRGYDGTASAPHVSGDQVQHIHTATDFPFRVDDTSGEYIGQAGIDMATFAISNVGAFALRSIGGDITNVGSITSNVGSDLVLKPEGSSYAVELATSAGKKRIVAETDNIRFYTANGLSETLIWDEAGIEWELQAKFNVNTQPFVGIDELVSAATKDLTLRPLDSDKAVSIKNYLEDPRIVIEASDITFYQADGTTPTLTWAEASSEWQLQATFNASGEDITGVEILTSTATSDLSLRPGNASYAAVLAASNGNKRVAAETNDITFYKADGISQTLRWDQTGDEWEFGETINANSQTLMNVLDPTDDSHVGDRGYNDARYAAGGDYLPLTGGTLTGSLFFNTGSTGEVRLNNGGYFTIDFAGASGGWARLFRFEYADGEYAGYGAYGGAPTTLYYLYMGQASHTSTTNFRWYPDGHLLAGGYLDMNGNAIVGPLDPTLGTHVGDRDYNDGRYAAIVAGGYLPLSGGTMTGDIDMSGNVLESVDAALYLDATSSGTVAQNIYLRTDDATGTRRNRVIIDGDGNATFYDQAGGQAMLYGTSYMQIDKNLTVGDNTLYGVADPTADGHVGDRAYNDTRYALSGTGVTNGDAHDHVGGDGAAISHADLIGVSPSQHHIRYSDAEAIAAVGTVMNGVPSGASLPLTGIAGDLFFLTTDEKLYRHNGTTWLVTTATSDLSGTITETQIEDNAITTGKLDANAVTAAKIEAGTITTSEIATDTILAGNIAAGAIEASEIATGAVTADAILAGAITTVSMTANTIDGDRITANTLDAAKITAGTITTDRMTAGTIDADRLTAGSITAAEIEAGTITTTELEANMVLVAGQAISASYLAGVSGWQIQQSGTAEFNEVIVRGALIGQAGSSISADYLTAGTIDASVIDVENLSADNITTGTLSAARIAANSLDASKITAGTITTDRMTVNTIDGDRITAGTLDADRITAGTITTDRMTAGTIDGDRITTNTLDADRITAGTITTDRMTAGTIDADRLTADSVTATQIDAGTITATELAASIVLVTGQAISASYVLDTSGWKIWQDGNAEFNEVTVRGALIAQAGSTISADYLTAGTIDAATIDVTNLDAANITTGNLSADRIAAGSLDAVKITAGSITTDRMTIDTIDGDRILANSLEAAKIVAGSITTDRMTANTISGDRIEGGTLEAVKIVAGSMTTTQFSSDTISGTIISTETLNADRLVAGSIGTDRMTAGTINADRLIAGSVTADELAAGSITAGKLAVQTMSNNLMPNPDFVWDSIGGTDDPHEYSTTYGGAFSAGTARLTGGVRSLRYTYGTGGPGTTWSLMGGTSIGNIPAQAGDKFHFSMWVRTSGTAPLLSPYYPFHFNWREADTTYIGSSQPGSISLSTTWTQVSLTATAPANSSYFNMYFDHGYTGSETGVETVEYSNMVLERVSPTVLIDNGAITTDKLFANAVTTEKMEADMVLVSGQTMSGSYVLNTSGWKIWQDGSAEFSDVYIRGDSVVEGSINATNIDTGNLHADRIATTSLNADNISSGTISASFIDSGTIGAYTINLANSATSKITSNDGTSWYIRGDGVALFSDVTISGTLDTSYVVGDLVLDTGGAFRTEDTGPRVVMSSAYAGYIEFISDSTYEDDYAHIQGSGTLGYPTLTVMGPTSTLGNDASYLLFETRANAPEVTLAASGDATGGYDIMKLTLGADQGMTFDVGGLINNTAYNIFTAHGESASQTYFDLSATTQMRAGAAGTAARPTYAFSASANTGLRLYGTGRLGIVTGGSDAAVFESNGDIKMAGSAIYMNGLAGNDYLHMPDSSNYFRVVLDNGEYFRVNTSGQAMSGDGSAGAPGHSFINDPNTGFYRYAENIIGVALGASVRAFFQVPTANGSAGLQGGGTFQSGAISRDVLGGTSGNIQRRGTFFFDVGSNNTSIEVQAVRDSNGSDWTTAAVGFRRVTDSTSQASLWFRGSYVGVGTTGPLSELDVNGQIYSNPSSIGGSTAYLYNRGSGKYELALASSSIRHKTDLTTFEANPLGAFHFYNENSEAWEYGLVAEYVQEAMGDIAVVFDDDGKVRDYRDRAVLSNHEQRIETLETRIAKLENLVATLGG